MKDTLFLILFSLFISIYCAKLPIGSYHYWMNKGTGYFFHEDKIIRIQKTSIKYYLNVQYDNYDTNTTLVARVNGVLKNIYACYKYKENDTSILCKEGYVSFSLSKATREEVEIALDSESEYIKESIEKCMLVKDLNYNYVYNNYVDNYVNKKENKNKKFNQVAILSSFVPIMCETLFFVPSGTYNIYFVTSKYYIVKTITRGKHITIAYYDIYNINNNKGNLTLDRSHSGYIFKILPDNCTDESLPLNSFIPIDVIHSKCPNVQKTLLIYDYSSIEILDAAGVVCKVKVDSISRGKFTKIFDDDRVDELLSSVDFIEEPLPINTGGIFQTSYEYQTGYLNRYYYVTPKFYSLYEEQKVDDYYYITFTCASNNITNQDTYTVTNTSLYIWKIHDGNYVITTSSTTSKSVNFEKSCKGISETIENVSLYAYEKFISLLNKAKDPNQMDKSQINSITMILLTILIVLIV